MNINLSINFNNNPTITFPLIYPILTVFYHVIA